MTVLKGLREAQKPGGKLYLVEYRLEDESVPIKLKHKMSKAQMILEMRANGLRFADEFDGLPWQHVMSFVKDPSHKPANPKAMENGQAVAEALKRALIAGDVLSLKGYYAPQVLLAENSAHLKGGAEIRGQGLSRDRWHKRFVAYMDSFPPETWRANISAMELRVKGAAGSDRVQLASTARDRACRWVLTRNESGQWLVTEELIGK